MNLVRSFVFACFCFTTLFVAGCSRGPTLHPVQGVVLLDGVPLKGGPRCYVVFVPDPKKDNLSPHEPKSTIGADGKYTIETVADKGAAEGWYKVRVEAADVVDPNNPYFTNWLAPKQYADPKTSGLEIEVKPGANYDLKLKSK